MKVSTPSQMKEIDKLSIEKFGIPGIVLMENAAVKVAEEIYKMLGSCRGKTAAVFAGKGNNGGDAYAIARHLFNRGMQVYVYSLSGTESLPADARTNLEILRKLGVNEIQVGLAGIRNKLNADILVDGIFGTGFRGAVTGMAARVIEQINASGIPVVSIDIPSGLDGLTGRAEGVCIKADVTVTFGLPKLGTVIHPGCEYCGRLAVADIGFPEAAAEQVGINISLIDGDFVKGIIPLRDKLSNKGDFGKVLLVTGSRGMTGAGCLCAKAALRAGSGLVYIAAPASLSEIYDSVVTEAVKLPLGDNGEGCISEAGAEIIPELLRGRDVVAAGPGLSTGEGAAKAVRKILSEANVPVVLDADALNIIAQDLSVLKDLKAPAVLTPHPGEMARLAGTTIDRVQSDRIGTALEFAQKWKVIVVLKGAGTIVALPDGKVFINTTGNPGMATGGTGDVLTGVIASLIGQGVEPGYAASAGVFIHGLAGDAVAAEKGEYGLIAGDVVEKLPYVIKQIIDNR